MTTTTTTTYRRSFRRHALAAREAGRLAATAPTLAARQAARRTRADHLARCAAIREEQTR